MTPVLSTAGLVVLFYCACAVGYILGIEREKKNTAKVAQDKTVEFALGVVAALNILGNEVGPIVAAAKPNEKLSAIMEAARVKADKAVGDLRARQAEFSS